jgi:2,3-bisphosphoglycerate-independent phosphoglycerate mutase
LKIGYILLDGCADRPDPRLNYTTPLEAAYTPHLDMIASRSRLGSVVTVGKGISPESDIAVFNMLGYSFQSGYPGRGVVEAVGAGLSFRDGDLALRANLATVRGDLIIDRRAGRNISQEEAESLESEINGLRLDGAEFEFKATVSYRGVLVLRASEPLSAEITNTDPAYSRVGGFGAAKATKKTEKVLRSRPESTDRAARLASELVNQFTSKCARVLARSDVNARREAEGKLPANCVLLRDSGDHLPSLMSFEQRYHMKGVAMVEMPAEVGIARLLGMRMVRIEDRNDLKRKAKVFDSELSDGSVAYVHIKGPDEFGHDGDPVGKRRCVEAIDRDFFDLAARRLGDATLAVSCDHATPCTLGMHSSDPVPLLVTSPREGDGMRFTERNSAGGSLGRLMGKEVLDLVVKTAGETGPRVTRRPA